MFQRFRATSPFVLAAVVTLLNSAKPVLIDDTAYLAYARHIAHHPLDPYGFDIFWYSEPESAMTVLAPPVLLYWLGLGIRLFGEHVFILKLWLFPFLWLLTWSVSGLLRRFAKGTERVALPLIVLSPAILPTVNFMLDIPALALGVAALHVFAIATERRSISLALVAGMLTALAFQTKYTMLVLPPILLWFGLTHRSTRLAGLAIAVALGGVVAWETTIQATYGQSHFLYHLRQQQPDPASSGWKKTLEAKYELTAPLVGHLGLLATGFGLFVARAIGVPRRWLMAFTGFWLVGIALIAFVPYQSAVLIRGDPTGREKLTLHATVWRLAGTVTLFTMAACSLVLLVRMRTGTEFRRNRQSLFLVGWVLVELAGYYVLTPFPAARRVIGVSIAIGLLAARTVSRMNRVRATAGPPQWIVPLITAVSLLVTALVTFDAFPEKVLAERAGKMPQVREQDATVWYAGHWGFQYYCERTGMKPVIDGKTIAEPGDYLVWPLIPDHAGFYRPNNLSVPRPPPATAAELIAIYEWDDVLSAQTIPNFYGGTEPIVGRDVPRLRVGLYRITRPWLVGEPWPLGERPHAADVLRGRIPDDE